MTGFAIARQADVDAKPVFGRRAFVSGLHDAGPAPVMTM